jgi:hypothetical protein
MPKQQVAAPVGVQSARRFTATAAYNETNPFALRFRGPKGTVSYSLGHQPKSFDWRARRAQPHLWKKAPEDAFANGLRNAEPDYCRRLRGSSTPHPSTAPVCNPLRRCTVFSSETVLVVFWGAPPGRKERYPQRLSPGREGPAAEKKKRTKRGRWTPAQRQKIIAAIYVAGASINEAAEAHHGSGGNTAYASWTMP